MVTACGTIRLIVRKREETEKKRGKRKEGVFCIGAEETRREEAEKAEEELLTAGITQNGIDPTAAFAQ